MSCAQPSSYQWIDAGGEARSVTQAEGGEKGPFLGALVLHRIQGALEEVAAALLPIFCATLQE